MYHWAKAAFPVTEIAAPISPVLLKKSNFSNQSAQELEIAVSELTEHMIWPVM